MSSGHYLQGAHTANQRVPSQNVLGVVEEWNQERKDVEKSEIEKAEEYMKRQEMRMKSVRDDPTKRHHHHHHHRNHHRLHRGEYHAAARFAKEDDTTTIISQEDTAEENEVIGSVTLDESPCHKKERTKMMRAACAVVTFFEGKGCRNHRAAAGERGAGA